MTFINTQNKILNFSILIAFILLVITRHVDFFIYPRFWAEEATQYFRDPYINGLSAIWHEHKGYYSLVPSVAGYFATFVPLEHAPLVTTLFAFFIQIIPFYLIFISKSEYLDTSLKKLFFSMIILFIGATPEIWLNSITSQFHFIIITFLLLIENKKLMSKIKTYMFYLLALLAGLSGIPANLLAPMFIYKFFMTKQKVNLHIVGIFALTTAIHLMFILSADRIHDMQNDISYNVLGNIFLSLFQYPIFYSGKINLDTLLILPLLYIIIKYLSQKKYFEIFFGSALFLGVVMILTSWGMNGGQRYVYASSVIFILGLTAGLFDTTLPKLIRIILLVYISTAIYNNIKHFPLVHGQFYSKNWKSWHQQALLYKEHSIEKIILYPPNWSVTLPRK